jgi:hypothetical protein
MSLFGMLYASVDCLIRWDIARFASTVPYFGVGGAVAGILVGGFAAIIDPELTHRLPSFSRFSLYPDPTVSSIMPVATTLTTDRNVFKQSPRSRPRFPRPSLN